jgi:hypothetical protein
LVVRLLEPWPVLELVVVGEVCLVVSRPALVSGAVSGPVTGSVIALPAVASDQVREAVLVVESRLVVGGDRYLRAARRDDGAATGRCT